MGCCGFQFKSPRRKSRRKGRESARHVVRTLTASSRGGKLPCNQRLGIGNSVSSEPQFNLRASTNAILHITDNEILCAGQQKGGGLKGPLQSGRGLHSESPSLTFSSFPTLLEWIHFSTCRYSTRSNCYCLFVSVSVHVASMCFLIAYEWAQCCMQAMTIHTSTPSAVSQVKQPRLHDV